MNNLQPIHRAAAAPTFNGEYLTTMDYDGVQLDLFGTYCRRNGFEVTDLGIGGQCVTLMVTPGVLRDAQGYVERHHYKTLMEYTANRV